MLVFLVGYMGSGKSTLGPALAHELQCDFIDLDMYIEQQYNKTIAAIFETEGEARFRDLEQLYLKQLIQLSKAVIAVGGGTPCFNSNMALMNANGVTIYLKADAQELAKRLDAEAREKRPIISNLSAEALVDFITKHLTAREPYYNKAKYTIATAGILAIKLIQLIKEQLKEIDNT